MLQYAFLFAVLALISGILGFVGLEGSFAWVARTLLLVFLVLFAIAIIAGRRGPVV